MPELGTDIQNCSVREILDLLGENWIIPEIKEDEYAPEEAINLELDSSLARTQLNWIPSWNLNRSIEETIFWYKKFYQTPQSALETTLKQINSWRHEIK